MQAFSFNLPQNGLCATRLENNYFPTQMPQKNTAIKLIVALVCLTLPAITFAADSQRLEKSNCSLFRATPSDHLRPLTSESQDGVTDARTLDAGHFQVEGALADCYKLDRMYDDFFPFYRHTHQTVETIIWVPKFTVGLLNNMDFYVSPSYQVTRYKYLTAYDVSGLGLYFSYNGSYKIKSFGSVATGFKINLWGNDSGTTALAVQPYLTIPTGDGDVLGGATLALLVRMPHGFYLKLGSQFSAIETTAFANSPNPFYVGFGNSVSLTKSLFSKADIYWYLNSNVNSDPASDWQGMTGAGLDFKFTRNLQLSLGVGFGLNQSAYDFNPRAAFVWRF